MTMQFYTAPNTISVATHIALEEAGLDYELVKLDFKTSDQTSEKYLAINPKARVPSLIVDDVVLTETPALLFFVAQLAPESTLGLPADPVTIAQIQSFNSYLASTVHIAHAHKMRGYRWTDDENAMAAMTNFVPTSMHACFELINKDMLKGPWVLGDQFSICDVYLHAISRWLKSDGVDAAAFPAVVEHTEQMAQRPSVKAVLSQY